MSELPASAQKVQDAANALGLDIAVAEMAQPTRTAEEAAAACGVTVGQIVKSLVFSGSESGKPYLLLVSGANRVNEKGVAAHLGEKLKRPDADERRRHARAGTTAVGRAGPGGERRSSRKRRRHAAHQISRSRSARRGAEEAGRRLVFYCGGS